MAKNGHLKKVKDVPGSVKSCYLPLHPVVKEASATTKVRVVFNASSETSTRVTLNDVLRWERSFKMTCEVMLVADVEKTFRQIVVREEDRPLQLILWRSSLEEEISTHELNTVTYGT